MLSTWGTKHICTRLFYENSDRWTGILLILGLTAIYEEDFHLPLNLIIEKTLGFFNETFRWGLVTAFIFELFCSASKEAPDNWLGNENVYKITQYLVRDPRSYWRKLKLKVIFHTSILQRNLIEGFLHKYTQVNPEDIQGFTLDSARDSLLVELSRSLRFENRIQISLNQ